MVGFISVNAGKYTYSFHNTPISKALVTLGQDNPDINIAFVYRELDNYKTSSKIDTDDISSALRQIIGLHPITFFEKKGNYYVEALQHGRYIYSGRVIGLDNAPVEAATIMLLATKDSTVLTYGITDNTGRFSIPCDMQGIIAKLSCVGYKTTYKKFDSFNVGTLIMHELPIKLKTVTVEGDNTSLLSNKSIYRPTQRQKSASQNAVDLLRHMAIPQISINFMDNTVTTLTGQNIAFYINYLPASPEDIEGLNTADVKRIECLDFPIDPRFNGKDHVLNFIIQKYKY